jgi:SOS response associated peptidase (SRAP)
MLGPKTLLEKPSFKQAVDKRRCLIPANGFYEWRRDGKRKVPMWIQFKTREPFAFPGPWDCWIDRETGKPLYTFTIITAHGNALLRPIHNRMPVMHRKDIGQQSNGHQVTISNCRSGPNRSCQRSLRPTRFRRWSIRLRTTRRKAFAV